MTTRRALVNAWPVHDKPQFVDHARASAIGRQVADKDTARWPFVTISRTSARLMSI
jgi:hypothetical protein